MPTSLSSKASAICASAVGVNISSWSSSTRMSPRARSQAYRLRAPTEPVVSVGQTFTRPSSQAQDAPPFGQIIHSHSLIVWAASESYASPRYSGLLVGVMMDIVLLDIDAHAIGRKPPHPVFDIVTGDVRPAHAE